MANKELKNYVSYVITDEEAMGVKKIFFDYTAHKSIISEIIRSDPSVTISETKVYSDYLKLMAEYDSAVSTLIDKYTCGERSIKDQWEVNFEKKVLTIYD